MKIDFDDNKLYSNEIPRGDAIRLSNYLEEGIEYNTALCNYVTVWASGRDQHNCSAGKHVYPQCETLWHETESNMSRGQRSALM